MTDYTVEDTIYLMFTTRAFATGIPTTLAGTPVVSAYENDSATQITAGITLGVDHDSVTGLNLLTIVATGANGYESGKDYNMVITTGTVDSVSVVGEVVGTFSLGRSAAAVDLANGTDGLGAIKTDTAAILSDTGTDGVVVASINANAVTATAIASNAITSAKIAASAIGASQIASNAITAAKIATDAITAAKIAADAIGSSELAATAVDEIVDAVWDEAQSGHVAAGSFGEVATEVAAILVDTAEIGAAGAGLTEAGGTGDQLTAIPWNASWDAEVQSEATDALNAYDPPTRAELTSDKDEIITDLDDIKGTGFVKDTHSLVDIEGYVDLIDDGTSGLAKIATDVAAVLVDTGTTLQAELDGIQADTEDIQARLPAALTGGGNIKADMLAISGDTQAADNLEEGATAIFYGKVNAGTPTTTAFIIAGLGGDTADATDDHYNGKVITFTTGALTKQSTDITDYVGSTKTVTVTALTEAPANNDEFVIT